VWVLMVLAVVWVMALTPMVFRRLSERNVVSSVTTFHRQLVKLGATWRPAPKNLIPGTALGFSPVTLRLWEERYTPPARGPGAHGSLAIGGEAGQVSPETHSAAADDAAAAQPRHATSTNRARGSSAMVAVVTPPATMARRRRVVFFLGTLTGLFLLLGVVPQARMLWSVALIFLAVLLAYLAALIHVHRVGAERARKVDALEARRHIVSALDQARRTTFLRAGTSRYAAAGSGRPARRTPSRSGSSSGSATVGARAPFEKQAAAGGR
jgi:hypothetical protein